MSALRPRRTRAFGFEARILAAILVTGLVPFGISLYYIPQIAEERAALSIHTRVREQLEASAGLYRELFDAKKKAFAVRTEGLARDPVLARAVDEQRWEDVRDRLAQLVDDNPDVRVARVVDLRPARTGGAGAGGGPGGEARVGEAAGDGAPGPLLEQEGPPERQGDDLTPKTFRHPLGSSAPGGPPTPGTLELTFVVPATLLSAQDEAAEVAYLYDASFKASETFQREQTLAYSLRVFFVLLAALTAGFFIARRVTRRVVRLAAATERVAQGELDFDLPLRGRDEIAELTAAFNHMVREVRASRGRIVYLEKVSGWQDLARRLAHEIKNPLTPIQLAVQELRRRTPEDVEPRFKRLVEASAEVVEDEIAALTRLVDEFSQFARLPEVQPEPVELRAFLDDFLDAYNRFAPDAEVRVDAGPGPFPARVDKVLMKRVLANLTTNAIQAAGAGRAVVQFRLAEAGGTLTLGVVDNGPGISAEDAEKVFEPYFTTKAEGTGLGLAIVKKIVLQHGGDITLSPPAPDRGAEFVITLRRASEAEG
jgi:signal transduction histidine kinase